jgi:hypothetical protein
MAAVVELLPMTRISGSAGEVWRQPTDSVVDVSGYTEAAIVLFIQSLDVADQSGQITIQLDTAIENREDHYVPYVTLDTLTYPNPTTYPVHVYCYLKGSTTGGSAAPGFARFIRVSVTGTHEGWHIAAGVQAVMKP